MYCTVLSNSKKDIHVSNIILHKLFAKITVAMEFENSGKIRETKLQKKPLLKPNIIASIKYILTGFYSIVHKI